MKILSANKKIRRFTLFVLAIASALLLTGCGASITVCEYAATGGGTVNEIKLFIDAATAERMEKTAIADEYGSPYTVESYFFRLFDDRGYELTDAFRDDTGYTAVYKKTFSDGALTDIGAMGRPEFEYSYSDGPFTRTVTATAQNPFNGLRKEYDEITNPNQSATLLQQLKNGKVATDENGDRSVLFPSVADAFPFLKGINLDGLLLNYASAGSDRMESSGKKTEYGDGRALYVFSRYFDQTETDIQYRYKLPVPYGWYIVALAAGGAVFAAIMLATRTKKQKPTLLDRFPYNPEEYRDYESRLPLNK